MCTFFLYFADDGQNDADVPSKSIDPEHQPSNKDKLLVCTVSIVCSCGKDPTNNAGQKCQSFGHTSTLVLALSIEKDNPVGDNTKTGGETKPCLSSESHLRSYILVYDILTNNETSAKSHLIVDSSIELEKEMMLQDPYTPSGSEDDWIYDQLPVLPPDTLHSSVLQKFAEAITGEENGNKSKVNKCKEENKSAKRVQCIDLSGVCEGQRCKVSEIVPFGDGQHLLVNFVCCSSCIYKELDPNDLKPGAVQLCADPVVVTASNSEHENKKLLSHEHSFTQSTLAVYRILSSNGKRTLSSQPTRTKQFSSSVGILSNLVALPVESRDLSGDTNVHFQELENEFFSPSQLLVGASNDAVVIIDTTSLNILTKFTPSNGSSKITHVLNCSGMDCFCVCTEDGMMRFLGLQNQLPGDAGVASAGQDKTDGISEAPSGGSWPQSGTCT